MCKSISIFVIVLGLISALTAFRLKKFLLTFLMFCGYSIVFVCFVLIIAFFFICDVQTTVDYKRDESGDEVITKEIFDRKIIERSSGDIVMHRHVEETVKFWK